MNKKKKLQMIIIMPALGTTIIVGGLVYLALQSGAKSAPNYLEDTRPAFERVDASAAVDCAFSYLIGQDVSNAYLNLGRPVRVIGPDDAVTQDFNPARVNVHTNDMGVVTKVSCG